MKKVFIINGSGGQGKDTFVRYVSYIAEIYNVTVHNYSSVAEIVKMAQMGGYDGSKTERDRKFLSDLKALWVAYNDFPFKCMTEVYNDMITKSGDHILFLHIREPEEIDRAVKAFNAKTILVTSNRVANITSNSSDGRVFDYEYDITIENNGPIGHLYQRADSFVLKYIV